jgi:hypothetical protein
LSKSFAGLFISLFGNHGPHNEIEARKKELMEKYLELEKKADEYYIEFVDLGGDKNLLLNNNQALRTNSKNSRENKIFEHIIKLKVHDLFEYAEMDNHDFKQCPKVPQVIKLLF